MTFIRHCRGCNRHTPKRKTQGIGLNQCYRIGPDAEVLLEFEGKKFRWYNGTIERDAIISMGAQETFMTKNRGMVG
jgi:hypothetical protein